MADFQFYRPQANPLERLWSQYAEAEGSRGGAFLRGLAPGLEAMGKNIAEQRNIRKAREFEAEQTEIKLAAEEKRRRKDEIAANQRLSASLRSDEDIAAKRNEADAARAAAERADKVIGSQALLQNAGFPDWAQRGEVIANPDIANQMIADRQQQLAKEEEDAALAAKEAKAEDARRSANSLLTRLLVNDAMTAPEAQAIAARLRVADEKGVVEIVGELGSRGMELDARRATIGDYERFTSELKELGKTGKLPQPRDQDAFHKAKYEAEAAYGKLRSAKDMAVLTPEQRASIKDELQRSVNDMRRLMGRSGMQDPSFKAQIAKDYPGLEAFQGQDIAYNNGRISGTAQQTANFQRMVNDRLKEDQEFRNQLRSVGVADGFDLNLYMSNPTAVMGETATPDKKAQIDQIVKAAKDRVGQQVLGELGASVNRVPLPNGYIDVGSMDDQQRAKFAQEITQAAVLFQQATGFAPTKSIGQQLAANLGYWDINAPTLRKAEPKPKEAPKATEAPKAKETPKAAQARMTQGQQDYAAAIGPSTPRNPVAGAVASVLATPEFKLRMPSKEEAKAIAQEETMRTRKMLYGRGGGNEQALEMLRAINNKRPATDRAAIQAKAAVAYGTPDPSFDPPIRVPPGGFGGANRQLPAGPEMPLLQTPGAGAPAIRVPPGGFGSSGPAINVPPRGFTPYVQTYMGGRVMRIPQPSRPLR